MFIKSSTILSAAIVLGCAAGAASPALAGYDYDGMYGGPRQTWCDINPDCNGWNKAHALPSAGNARAAVVVAPTQKHRPSHKPAHEASNR